MIEASDDRLLIPEVGAWAKRKYSLIRYYADMFATRMKNIFKDLSQI